MSPLNLGSVKKGDFWVFFWFWGVLDGFSGGNLGSRGVGATLNPDGAGNALAWGFWGYFGGFWGKFGVPWAPMWGRAARGSREIPNVLWGAAAFKRKGHKHVNIP